MKPLDAFSKSSPRPSRSDALMVTLGSRRMLAGFPSSEKETPARLFEQLVYLDARSGLAHGVLFLVRCNQTSGFLFF